MRIFIFFILFLLSSCIIAQDSIVIIHSGEGYTITDNPYTSYQWSTGATTKTISVSPITTTTYTVLSTTNNGTASVSITITIDNNIDANVQAYADSIGDMKPSFKSALNTLVKAMKLNGTWDSVKVFLPFPPSMNMTYSTFTGQSLRDLKSNSIVATYSAVTTPTGATWHINDVYVGSNGLTFNKNAGTGWVKTNFIPSTLKLNNTSILFCVTHADINNTGYSFGASQSSTQDIIFNYRDGSGSNKCFADMYSQTNGRATVSNATGDAGVYILNRQSTSNFKILRNGSTIATQTLSQGSFPTIQMYLNGYNNNGSDATRRNKQIGGFCVYGQSLTDAQAAQEQSDWNTFLNSTHRSGFTKTILFDGNSYLTVYWGKIDRQLEYDLSDDTINREWVNIGIAGQTTAQMITRAATSIDKMYQSGAVNVLIPIEITNDIAVGGLTAIQSYNNYVTYCNARKAYAVAHGLTMKIIAVMPIQMSCNCSGNTSRILKVDSVVTMMKAGWNTFADTLADFPDSIHYFIPRSNYSSDAAYVTAVNALCANTTYYTVVSGYGSHPSEYGCVLWAEKLKGYIKHY